MTEYAKHTLNGLARTIAEIEQQAQDARKERDRLLRKAGESAQAVGDLIEQAWNLREILSGADSEFYARAFGAPFDGLAEPDRSELISSYRDAIAYLETQPQLPLDVRHISLSTPGRHDSDEDKRAEITRIAGLLDAEIFSYSSYNGKLTMHVRRQFGSVSLYASVDVEPEPQPAASAEQDGGAR